MASKGDVIKKPYEHEPLGVLTQLTFWPKVISIEDVAVIAENKRKICVFEMYIINFYNNGVLYNKCF